MNRQRIGSHAISGAFVFLLLGVFAVFATVLTLLGVGAYNRTSDSALAHNQARIAPAYLRTMVRGHDAEGRLRVERLTGIQREDEDTGEISVESVDLAAIVLDDEAAFTRVFVYGGWLYECSEPRDEEALFDSGDAAFEEDGAATDEEDEEDADPGDGTAAGDIEEETEQPEETALPEGVCPAYRMQPVCEAEDMEAEIRDGLLVIRLKSGGAWSEVACALHAPVP